MKPSCARLTREQFGDEQSVHTYTAFASDLGFAPGQWPTRIECTTKIGNGCAFMPHRATAEAVVYLQGNGCVSFIIYND